MVIFRHSCGWENIRESNFCGGCGVQLREEGNAVRARLGLPMKQQTAVVYDETSDISEEQVNRLTKLLHEKARMSGQVVGLPKFPPCVGCGADAGAVHQQGCKEMVRLGHMCAKCGVGIPGQAVCVQNQAKDAVVRECNKCNPLRSLCGCQGEMPQHYVGMVARCVTCKGWKPATVTLGNDDLPTPTMVKRGDQ